jgi:hypothetical protein
VDVGGSWPFPPEWGTPRVIPDRARVDNEAAARFLGDWAAGKVRQRDGLRPHPLGRLDGAAARRLIERRRPGA